MFILTQFLTTLRAYCGFVLSPSCRRPAVIQWDPMTDEIAFLWLPWSAPACWLTSSRRTLPPARGDSRLTTI